MWLMLAGLIIALVATTIGFLVGRWAIVLLVAAAWPLYFIGLRQDWWGNGVGDGWQFVLAAETAIAAVGAVLGVFARQRLSAARPLLALRSRRPSRDPRM
jgi:hypothetical protein